jgi:hypothetical protein
MKLKKYLEEAEVIKFKSKRVDDLEKEIDQAAGIVHKYLLGLAFLERSLTQKASPANEVLLDVISAHVTDFGEFIKRTWPVSYKGLKKSKLKLFGKKK